ncbi:hypothetical protein Tco_0960764, partial [Tanacetum coccineum]
MKEAISLMGRSESVFRMTSNIVYQLPSEPSRQEEFKNLVMNFILDQEEKVKQLEEYMGVIGSDFMKLSLEEMFDDDWGLKSKEVSPLGEELSLFDRPNKVERGRILEAHHLESILQQQISQRMAPSHHD